MEDNRDVREEREEKKKRRVGAKGIIILILLVILLFTALIGWITDFMWFRELTYVSVFLTKLFTQIKIGVPVFVVVTFLAYVYLKFIKRGYMKKIDLSSGAEQKIPAVCAQREHFYVYEA